MNPTRILLVDDHALVRAGIRALIEGKPGIEVIAETGDGEEALRMIAELRPNLVLLDITIPALNGFEVLEQITKQYPQTRVIILTVHEGTEYAMRALRSGAAGYLPKSAASIELEDAISAVAQGGTYLSHEISQKTLFEYAQARTPQDLLASLTSRQREILKLIAEGQSTKEIGSNLNISVKTVESHRAKLAEKLDIHDVAGLVRFAIRVGLIQVE
ncbi:MAG TPA: response regulator transcription factor [Pyrinomonadaceae bacterium]